MTPRPSRPDRQAAQIDAALGPAPEAHSRPEVVVLRLRRHGRRLVLPVLVLAAVAAASGYWIGNLPEAWMNTAAAAAAVAAAVLLGVLPVCSWLSQRTVITTRRAIQYRGFLVRRRTDLPLGRVREVRTRRGPVQRMHGAGDVELLVGAETVRLRDLPGVQAVSDALQELVERNYSASHEYGVAAPRDPGAGFPYGPPAPSGRPTRADEHPLAP